VQLERLCRYLLRPPLAQERDAVADLARWDRAALDRPPAEWP
jgi:hypothetical protein